MKDFVFVTGNMHKVKWIEKFLGSEVEHHKLDLDELQSPIPEEVLEQKARLAFEELQRPVLVDDVSLSFDEWGDMPGTFIKFFVEGPGLEKICRMLDGFENRGALMTVSYGYFDGNDFTICSHSTTGSIAKEPSTNSMGHGFDGIFIREGHTVTHADMDEENYKKNHPRGMAVDKLRVFLNE